MKESLQKLQGSYIKYVLIAALVLGGIYFWNNYQVDKWNSKINTQNIIIAQYEKDIEYSDSIVARLSRQNEHLIDSVFKITSQIDSINEVNKRLKDDYEKKNDEIDNANVSDIINELDDLFSRASN